MIATIRRRSVSVRDGTRAMRWRRPEAGCAKIMPRFRGGCLAGAGEHRPGRRVVCGKAASLNSRADGREAQGSGVPGSCYGVLLLRSGEGVGCDKDPLGSGAGGRPGRGREWTATRTRRSDPGAGVGTVGASSGRTGPRPSRAPGSSVRRSRRILAGRRAASSRRGAAAVSTCRGPSSAPGRASRPR